VIDDTDSAAVEEAQAAWKVAVIDDDPAVHEGTRFALYDYSLNGQGIEIVSAYSAAEGRELMRTTDNVALVLLDVVMETDDTGLELIDYIRTQLKNETVRIILLHWPARPGAGAPRYRRLRRYQRLQAKTNFTPTSTKGSRRRRSYQQLQRMVETGVGWK
jgi:CheY-like chemotaxis protein